jgi:hypothetical protein
MGKKELLTKPASYAVSEARLSAVSTPDAYMEGWERRVEASALFIKVPERVVLISPVLDLWYVPGTIPTRAGTMREGDWFGVTCDLVLATLSSFVQCSQQALSLSVNWANEHVAEHVARTLEEKSRSARV